MSIEKSEIKTIDPEIEKAYSRSRLLGDEILVACVGSIGKVVLVDESCKGFNVVRATARVRCCDDVERIYLAYYLLTPHIQNYFVSTTRTVSQPTLNIRQIEETRILVPPINLQKTFAEIVHYAIGIKVKLNESDKELTSQFNALVQRAFRGEL